MAGEAIYPARVEMLGLAMDNLTMEQAIFRIREMLSEPVPRRIYFLNAHCMNVACRDLAYRQALARADLVLADGSGLDLAGRLLGRRLRENVNGTGLFPELCARLENSGHGVYLLGGGQGVADGVARWMREQFLGLAVAGWRDGFFPPGQDSQVAADIAASGAHLLLVALGAPKQELWRDRHMAACGVRAGLAVGGLFDFHSGRIPRAPRWMRRLGLEWTWRLMQEPGRMWRRYLLGNFLFISRIWAERRGKTPGPAGRAGSNESHNQRHRLVSGPGSRRRTPAQRHVALGGPALPATRGGVSGFSGCL